MAVPKTTCEILFESNPKQFYYAGEMCKGTVNLTIFKEKLVRGIYIKIEGNGYARWETGAGEHRSVHTGEEKYLSEKFYCLGINNGDRDIAVQPGKYVYPFECRLPIKLPSSIEGEHGHIRYKVSLVIDRHMWPNKSYTNGFTVFKRMDLNDCQMYQQPIIRYLREDFGSICCCYSSSEVMIITIHLAPSAYIPGESINIDIETKNDSNVFITNYRIQLIKVVGFQKSSTNPRNIVETSIIIEKIVDGCNGHENTKTEVKIPLDQIQPTDMTHSAICKVYYKLKIKAIVNTLFRNPTIELPITIGTIPFSTLNVSQMDTGRDIGFIVDSQPTNAPTNHVNNSPTAVTSSSSSYHFSIPIGAITSTAPVYGLTNKTLIQQPDNLIGDIFGAIAIALIFIYFNRLCFFFMYYRIDPPTYEEATIPPYPLN